MASSNTRAEFLRSVPIFAGLPEMALEQLADRAEWVEVSAGEWLFREGEPVDCCFVLRSGRLQVLREAGDVEVAIRTLSPGAVLGELGVLTGAERSARPGGPAPGLSRGYPAERQGSPRDRGCLAGGSRGGRGSGGAIGRQARPLADREAARRRGGRPRRRLRRRPGPLGARRRSGRPSRTARSRQRVARVLPATGGPGPGGADSSSPGSLDRRVSGADLAVLDWPRSKPGLGAWTEALAPRSVHKVRSGRWAGKDLDSLARRLGGRSLGVVLSGGGARGLAHIGVLEELLATGLPIDRVGGCSMGAVIGALFASGLGPDEIEARLREELVEQNPMSDYTVPLAALVPGRKAEAMLLRLFGEILIEELPREFFCVSCDLVSSDLIVHRRGSLYESVGASVCLPGIGPPVALDGGLLVDGGVLNNLPVETMVVRGEGPVVAVDVSSRFEPPSSGRRTASTPT